MLLCDSYDAAYHGFCLVPSLLAIPGEWRKLNDHVQETWSKIYGDRQDLSSQYAGGEKVLDVPPALKKELCSSGARVAFSLQN
ncbi:hypothetical protein PsorP6_006838 [Peronosclerospora sorghi]|uniref:Uncharacterized protein n=1 Tax=Peronosclerospora sorghi TaxID=230839 RepID=A0ACC0W7V5_9STRA|nr:hypothetical protein PsorP6_006838 [Peronosclerospora sorghi]